VRIGVPCESRPDERRVAGTPETVRKLLERGHTVVVESGAGEGSSILDAEYVAAGATIGGFADAWSAELVLKVQRPRALEDGRHEADLLHEGAWLVSFLYPGEDEDTVARLRARKITVLAMEAVPRIARAQKMDALSSMANIAGYRAVIEAMNVFPKFMPLLMTAAGTVPPAQVLVIGVGVAGLSAIATARRMGAQVKAFDVRPAVRDQVKSVGAEFLTIEMPAVDAEDKGGYAKDVGAEILRREQELFTEVCRTTDIVITTALVAGRKAPLLLTADAVHGMRPGSVIVDLAIEQGGNCALSVPGTCAEVGGVRILGFTNLASRMPQDASRLYARNVLNLLVHLHGKEGWKPDFTEEVTGAVAVIRPEST
jgi:NAD(P) transhydrogenase subunit alpha